MRKDKAEPIVLVLGCDQAYFEGLWVTIVSMGIHYCSPRALLVYIFDGGIRSSSKTTLEEEIKKLNTDVNIQWIKPDINLLKDCKAMDDSSLIPYVRLLIPRVIPHDKCIWLDVDLLVLIDINELWEIELPSQFSIAACLEAPNTLFSDDVGNLKDINIPTDSPYFNSGVLLINNTSLREKNFTASALKYIEQEQGNYKTHDQGAINVVLYNKIYTLPRKWNFLNTLITDPKNEIEILSESGHIFHFLQRPKPWQRYSGYIHSKLFYRLSVASNLQITKLRNRNNLWEQFKWAFPRFVLAVYRLKNLIFRIDEKLYENIILSQKQRAAYKDYYQEEKHEIDAIEKSLVARYHKKTNWVDE